MVKSYEKEKSVPILATHIMRNRYRDDIVGCQILVLQDDKNKCLSDDIWPDGVKCIEWVVKRQNQGDRKAADQDTHEWNHIREWVGWMTNYRVHCRL